MNYFKKDAWLLLKGIKHDHPRATEKEHMTRWLDAIAADAGYLGSAMQPAWDANYKHFPVVQVSANVHDVPDLRPAKTATIRRPHTLTMRPRREIEAERQKEQQRVQRLVKVVRNTVLMDQCGPDGVTKLRDANANQLMHWGGYYSRIGKHLAAKHGRRAVVGKHLTEEDVRNLYQQAA